MTEDEKTIAHLDRDQLAVKNHDLATIRRIHADDVVLVLGSRKVATGAHLEEHARKATMKYEKQDEVDGTQNVRAWGDTGVVTAQALKAA